jgi:PKD repeat protein
MKNRIKNIFWFLVAIVTITTFNSCDGQYEPLGTNSIPDATPPTANFAYSQGSGDVDAWKTYTFANSSTSATTYEWTFGDGNTSTEIDPVNTYPGEGTYAVTLTASDALGVSSTVSIDITVVQPEVQTAILPTIGESGFEDGSDACGTAMDGRDCWRNSSLGGVIQITSSPVYEGSQAAKFPSAGDRVGYQELTVSPNADYVLTYYYTLKTNNPGSVTVSVLAGGAHTDLTSALNASIASFEGTDQTDSNAYVQAVLPFNSGANDTISILITNQGEEARVDAFSISN